MPSNPFTTKLAWRRNSSICSDIFLFSNAVLLFLNRFLTVTCETSRYHKAFWSRSLTTSSWVDLDVNLDRDMIMWWAIMFDLTIFGSNDSICCLFIIRHLISTFTWCIMIFLFSRSPCMSFLCGCILPSFIVSLADSGRVSILLIISSKSCAFARNSGSLAFRSSLSISIALFFIHTISSFPRRSIFSTCCFIDSNCCFIIFTCWFWKSILFSKSSKVWSPGAELFLWASFDRTPWLACCVASCRDCLPPFPGSDLTSRPRSCDPVKSTPIFNCRGCGQDRNASESNWNERINCCDGSSPGTVSIPIVRREFSPCSLSCIQNTVYHILHVLCSTRGCNLPWKIVFQLKTMVIIFDDSWWYGNSIAKSDLSISYEA